MNDRILDQAALELAALYALSALAPSEMEEVERDYHAQPAFWAEVRSLRDAAAGLAASGPRRKPRRDLWPEIRARVTASARGDGSGGDVPLQVVPPRVPSQVWKEWGGTPAREGWILSAQEGDFEPTDIQGISVRRLFVDQAADRVTMLVRMAPGTAYPAHRHAGIEECYVLAGDLSIGAETTLRSGDYQRMDTGSLHPVQATREGCLLWIASSRHDELLG